MTARSSRRAQRQDEIERWHRRRIRVASTPGQRVHFAAGYAQSVLNKLPDTVSEQLAEKIVNTVLRMLREVRS